MADRCSCTAADPEFFCPKSRVADQFCIAKHYGNHCHLFYQYGNHLSGIYHGGGNQCGQRADNGNPGDSWDCNAVWAFLVQNTVKVFRFLLYFIKDDRIARILAYSPIWQMILLMFIIIIHFFHQYSKVEFYGIMKILWLKTGNFLYAIEAKEQSISMKK